MAFASGASPLEATVNQQAPLGQVVDWGETRYLYVVANAPVTAGQWVSFVGANEVSPTVSKEDVSILAGISHCDAGSGEYFLVQTYGEATAITAAAVSAGDEIDLDASGQKVETATPITDKASICGWALEVSSGADETIKVFLRF